MNTSADKNKPFDFDVSKYPSLPKYAGVLVTGTDTEVGKTLIAGAIANCLRRRGKAVEVFKPVATGCRHARGELVSADAEFLASMADSRRMPSEITPLRYASATAPNIAAAREHRKVDLPAIFETYSRIGKCDALVVEGVGGLLCPISDDFWVIHFAKLTRLPLVVVARAGLGTINHTLLTLHAARSAGIRVAGIIINGYRADPTREQPLAEMAGPYKIGDADLAMHTNPAQIASLGRTEILAIVPQDAESSVKDARIGPDVQFAVGQVDWERVLGL